MTKSLQPAGEALAEKPMDLTDWLFEVAWYAKHANTAHKRDQPKAAVRIHLEAAKDAIERALKLL